MNSAQFKQWLFNNFWYGEQGGEKAFKRYGQSVVYTLVVPDISKVWGVDISHWNRPPVNLKRMKDMYGMSFVIIKGHDGTIKSNYFEQHVQAAREAGIPWFIYDWLYPNSKVSVEAQTTAWVNQYKAYADCSGVKIDAEWTFYAGKAANPNATDLRLAHNGFYSKSGKRAVTYTAKGYADQYLIGFDWSREELWAAHYGVNVPALPSGALKYILHQFSSTLNGKLLDPAGNAELDGNYFNGTKAQFAARYGFPSSPPPDLPPNGDNMIYVNKVTTSALNGRSTPDSTISNVVIAFQLNDLLICDQQKTVSGASWRRVRACIRNGTNVPLPAGDIWASDGSAGTLQGELSSFDAGLDIANLSVHTSLNLTFADGDGNVIGTKGAENVELT